MQKPDLHDLVDTVDTDIGRQAMMEEIVAKIGGLDVTSSDDDLDLWWGSVEIDRMASGLTLATIAKLSASSSEDEPAGPWLRKSDATGDELTQLTPDGREALRRIGVAGGAVSDVEASSSSQLQ